VPRPPGRACFDLVWNSLTPKRQYCVAPAKRGCGPPPPRPVSGCVRFHRGPLVGLPGVKQPTIRKARAQRARKRADSGFPQTAPSREPPAAGRFATRLTAGVIALGGVFIRLRIAHSHKPALFARRGSKPAGAAAQRIASLRLR
jgi:hypothetical protein